jgi:tetratricopeptide (TPR) repeat protein
VASDQQDYPAARALYERSLAIARELGVVWSVALALNNLGMVSYQQGRGAEARALLEECLALRRELGDRNGVAYTLFNLGNVLREQGDFAAARADYQESLTLRRELGDSVGIAYCLEAFAALARDADPEGTRRAARLWGGAEALRAQIGAPLTPGGREGLERDKEAVRAALGEEAFAAAWAEGRALTPEQAIADALSSSL